MFRVCGPGPALGRLNNFYLLVTDRDSEIGDCLVLIERNYGVLEGVCLWSNS